MPFLKYYNVQKSESKFSLGNKSLSLPPQNVARGLCTEFNAQQHLFEPFSHIIPIFGSVEP